MSVTPPSPSPVSPPEPGQPSTGKGPLQQTATTTATDYWNGSCSVEELTYPIERGLQRRQATGENVASMTPVCRLMVGRLDDWLQVLVKRDGVVATPGIERWAASPA